MTGLTAAQREQLLQPLHPGRVSKEGGRSHLEAYDVRRWLTRIFGHTGWSFTVLETELVYSRVDQPVNAQGFADGKPRATAVYRTTGRLTIRDQDGVELGHWDDCATGDGVNMPSVGDAHDFAIKTSASQTLKRCAVNLGDQFGLSLYAKGSLDAMVVRTMVPEAGGPAAAPAPAALVDLHDAPVVREEAPYEDEVPQDGPAADALPQTHWETPEPPRMHDGQKRAMFALFGRLGVKDDTPRHTLTSWFVGRNVASANDLGPAEGTRLVGALQTMADATRASASVRDESFAALDEMLTAAGGPGQIAEAYNAINEEAMAGRITPGDVAALAAHWHARRATLEGAS